MLAQKKLIALFVGALVASVIGCSKVAFEKIPETNCDNSGVSCLHVNGLDVYDYTIEAPRSAVDILFVVDNSASMSPVQHEIADKFPSFLNSIDSLDYQIAITTTDISDSSNGPRSINKSGALQDGKFIQFGSGSKILTRSSSNKQGLFSAAIQRQETLTCENYLTYQCPQGGCPDYNTYCPSPDTRGIYSAVMAVDRNEAGFFRMDVPLAVVIISNADERAMGGRISGYNQLVTNDLPETLIQNVKQKFSSRKNMTAHSLIIRPGDQACYDAQRSHGSLLFGWTGDYYAKLGQLTNGVVGNICAFDYGLELGNIGHSVVDQISNVDLPCRPANDEIQIDMTPDQGIAYQLLGPTYKKVQFNRDVPQGTKIRLRFKCGT